MACEAVRICLEPDTVLFKNTLKCKIIIANDLYRYDVTQETLTRIVCRNVQVRSLEAVPGEWL